MGIKFGKLFKSVEEDVVPEDVVPEDVVPEDVVPEDVVPEDIVSEAGKRKRTDDCENLQHLKRRRLDSDSSENELAWTSGDTESRNTPEAALSQRSARRKAVANDGPVKTKKRTLDPSAMFAAKYEQKELIGKGGYGAVFAGYRKADNLPVAIKRIPADQEILIHQDDDGELIPMEVTVMKKLAADSKRHPSHIYLLDWYDLGEELALVMERPTTAVNLQQYITAKGGHLEEGEAKIIMRQLVDAAIDLQEKKIFHRDMKVDNLLIETGSAVPRVRVIDFGVGCFFKEGDQYNEFYGYIDPPEWQNRLEYKAGPTTVYQIGAILLDMLQNPSFKGGVVYQRPIIKWWFSENCRAFFKGCVHTEPEQRLTLEQLRNHLWLR